MLILVLKIMIGLGIVTGLWQLFLLYYSGVGYLTLKQNQYTKTEFEFLKQGRLKIFKRVIRNLSVVIFLLSIIIFIYLNQNGLI